MNWKKLSDKIIEDRDLDLTIPDPKTFEDAFELVVYNLREIMFDRQRKYGPENINAFGELGILVRSMDKLQRLKHLHFSDGVETQDESVDDSWIDLANYAIIALMVRRGIWGLPLKDLK